MARDGSPAARASSCTSTLLSRLFRGRFLTMLIKAHAQDRLKFFADHAALADKRAFKRFLAPLRKIEWVVYTKNPFAGPEQVLRYLSRYTHRVAISNRRLVSTDDNGVAFRWKDYRIDGPERWKTMTLTPTSSSGASSSHVLPKGFHRIRHYGLFASGNRAANIARARQLLGAAPPVVEYEEQKAAASDEPRVLPCPCPRCGGQMIVIEVFARGCEPTYRPTPAPTRRSTRHDRCSHCSPQSHPSRTPVIGQRRSRSPCRPSPLLQCNRKPMPRPFAGPPHTPAYPPTARPSQIAPPKIDHRDRAPRG